MEVGSIILELVEALKKQASVNALALECLIEITATFPAKDEREPIVKVLKSMVAAVSDQREALDSVAGAALKALKNEQ